MGATPVRIALVRSAGQQLARPERPYYERLLAAARDLRDQAALAAARFFSSAVCIQSLIHSRAGDATKIEL